MDFGAIVNVLGYLLLIEAGLMVPSLLVALYYNGPDKMGILISILIILIAGFIMSRISRYRDEDIQGKEGLAIVGFGWIIISVFGALPYILTDTVPSFTNAFFETVSGFTTTGATIIDNIDSLPKGILFWRSFTNWIGGMGILVFTVAIFPMLGLGGFQIYKMESPGPMADRIVPRVRDTAKILYIIYSTFTIIQIILLMLGGMSFYDAAVHTFGTAGTGGFNIKANSIGFYNSSYIHLIVGVFMILCGINFSLHYSLIKGKWKDALKNEELRLYLSIIGISIFLITFNIYNKMDYKSFGLALKDSFFQVSSMITTTAYSTVDYNSWPTFSKLILFILMFLGGCAGSTAGGIKIVRILILVKTIKREFYKILHPRAVIPIKVNNKPIASDTVIGIGAFFMLYILLLTFAIIIISLEGLDFETTISTAVATLSNIGPGFGATGPVSTYSQFSSLTKLFMTGFMLLGRLELFPLIILLNPSIWKSENFIKHR